MSGASGKIPSAIHMAPEAANGGPIAKVRAGDILLLDTNTGEMTIKVPADEFAARAPSPFQPNQSHIGLGREMFGGFRSAVSGAEHGASIFDFTQGRMND